mgnify:CR=1 FL=1
MPTYNFGQLEQLWTANGGQPGLAPTMAAIALAESGGNSGSLNNNPSTGDYSVGLWQINYYGGLLGPRTQAYGAPATLQGDPNAQAKAAISLAGGGGGLSNWTTYTSGAYKQYLNGATPYVGPDPNQTATSTGGGVSTSGGGCTGKAVVSLPSVAGIGGGTLLTDCNVKAIKGGLLLVAGGGLFVIGGLVLVAYGLQRTGTGKAAASAVKATPAGRLVKGAGQARAYNRQTARQTERTRSVEAARTEGHVTRAEATASSRRYGATRPRSEPSGAAGRRRGNRSYERRTRADGAAVNEYGEELF